MRFELAGSLSHPDPVTLTYLTGPDEFDPTAYIAMGYTNFDVICIGGAGGMGGGIDTNNTGTLIRSYGGAGGGGGLHRVQGRLSDLPASCPIVVGVGGDAGHEHSFDPAQTTDGGDGGYSSFNDTTCRASGGVGGKRVQRNSTTTSTEANGGDGGIGDRIIVGGGGSGGIAGTPADPGPGDAGSDGSDGTWNGTIGSGGGGGAGGVGKYGSGGSTLNEATAGGRGSYSSSDLSVYAPAGEASQDSESGAIRIVPGFAGGAKGSPLNGMPTIYGSSKETLTWGDPGVVIIRLTAE